MYIVNFMMFLIVCEFVCAFPGNLHFLYLNTKQVANESIICEHEHELTQHIRVKREQPGGGVGNFADAAKMPQMKSLRLFLQFFKNLWSNVYLGGSHPLHPNVPKTFVELYHEKVEKVFFPPAGGDPNKRPET